MTRYESTATPVARVLITAVATKHRRTVDAEFAARQERNRVMREQHAAGVSVQDIAGILSAAGYAMTATHIGRIVEGARDE